MMTQRLWCSWGLFLLLVIAAACSLDTRSYRAPTERPSATAAPEAADKAALPAALRAAYVASVQKDAEPAYHIERASSGLRAKSHAQGLVAQFTSTSVQLAPATAEGGEAFGIAATEWGCEGALTKVGPAEPEAQGNRVTYRREGFDEWYVNGPLGLEQGFTLPAPPACRGKGGHEVVIALGRGSELGAEVLAQGDAAVLRDRSGKEVLRSTDLYVVDATGRQLPGTLARRAGGLSIRVDDRDAIYPVEVDPLWIQQQTLVASDGTAVDRFGFSIAVDGDTALVGAAGKASLQGAAYVFVRSGSSWTQQQTLTASDGAANDRFGSSVAVSGDTALVGAVDKASSQGAAYVFVPLCATVTCPPPGPCQEAGKCNPLDGACSYPPKNEGLPCDDTSPCTQEDTCQMGKCKGIENTCKAPDQCHGDGECDPTTGTCSYPTKPCALVADAGPPAVVSGKLKNCQSDDDCKDQEGHGHCSEEHVCCDTACGEACRSCRLPGAEGTCTDELHTDLKHDCGPKGYCLKTCEVGACVEFTGKRQCAPTECTDTTHVAEEVYCDGTEKECPLEQRTSFLCDPNACDQIQGACLRECATVNDCAPPFVCDPSHRCVPAPGVAVGADSACAFEPASPASSGARSALAAVALAALAVGRRRRGARRAAI